jgi:hypothetical protein
MKLKHTVLLFIIISFACPALLHSQSNQTTDLTEPYLIYSRKINQGDYLGAYLELKKHEAEYKTSPQFVRNFLQLMSVLGSQVGEYKAAHGYLDEFFSRQSKPQKDLESSPIDNYEPRSAVDAIASAAETQQVIMINEEHDTPMHRAFTTRLLPILYAKGFRYLAAETIADSDTDLNKRGYPMQKTGFYTTDPVYGDMIRTALID